MSKISSNFDIREFVPPIIWRRYGANSRWFVDPKIISLAEFYRSYFGVPVYVNTWFYGGNLSGRGYRTPNTTWGALYSQHKRGAAFDCHIKGLTTTEIYEAIISKTSKFMAQGLTTLEKLERKDGSLRTWIHSDIRNTGLNNDILIVQG